MAGISNCTTALSQAPDWVEAAKDLEAQLIPLARLKPGHSWLAFIYATDALADDLSSILTYLKQKTAIGHWVGSLGAGICCGRHEVFGRAGVTVMICQLPEKAFNVLPTISAGADEIPAAKRQWARDTMPPFGIVHGDPTNRHIVALIEGLSMDIENLALQVPGFLVGGLTASQGAFYQVAQVVTQGGLSGVLLAPDIEVATSLSQGCCPVGPSHRITEAQGGVVMALDNQPALEVFKHDIGELLARDLSRVDGYIHAALPVSGSDMGDYVVRSLLGVDPEHKWIAIAGDPKVGEQVMFVRRDPKAAEEDLMRMAAQLKRRVNGKPQGGLYFSCVGRGPGLFGAEGAEMAVLARTLGDFPLVGFFGNGEVSNNRLYGYTGVLCLFL